MKRKIQFLLSGLGGLIAAVNLAGAQPLHPEVLASFNGTNGAYPHGTLTQGNDGNFYGTTFQGGLFGKGTVFKATADGVLATLVSFDGTNGANPNAGFTLGNDGNFYGTTGQGGRFGYGTMFRVTTNGGLTMLVSFDGTNGANPAGLTLGNDGDFYGIGSGGVGTVFKATSSGVLTALASFGTNGGMFPLDLTLGSDGNFYGTTSGSSYFGVYGTIFRVTPSGTLTTLASLADLYFGEYSYAGLTLGGDGNFCGTAVDYGLGSVYGRVFQVTTNGVVTTLAWFDYDNGATPYEGLAAGSDGNFYGTTSQGGGSGNGTLFQVTTNGVLTTLVTFDANYGAGLGGNLTQGSDGNFYGLAQGVEYGYGAIYRLRRGVTIQSFGMAISGFQLNTLNVGGSGWVVLESSNDLIHWMPIQTNGTAAVQQFLDPAGLTQPQQFYRVRQQ